MDTRLLAELESHIQRWADENCEEDWWPDAFTGSQTVVLMSKAAAAVFDAVISLQHLDEIDGR